MYGGAISAYKNESVSIFENCIFNNNKALDNAGVMTTGETPNVFKDCSFINNSAPWGGALVLYTKSNSEIINCTFEGNHATSGEGGAINAAIDSYITIYNSAFKGNEAHVNGGAIYCKQGADLTAYNTLFSGNVNGRVMDTDPSITNSGSAVYAYDSKINLINNTIVANYSFDDVNGAPVNNWSAEMNIRNSIIYNNRGAEQIRFVGGATGDVFNSLIQGGFTGSGNFDQYPMFLGAISPSSSPSTQGNFTLLGNSPANNKGVNTLLPKDKWDLDNDGDKNEVIPFDLNGNPRVFAGVIDLGCFEQQLYTESGNGIGVWDGTHMDMGSSGLPLNGTDFTIELWYYMQAGMDGSLHNIFGSAPGVTERRSPSLYVFQNDRLHYGYGNGSSWASGETGKAIKLNQWNHIALSFNNSTNTMKVYTNGKFLEVMTGGGEVYSNPLFKINNSESLHGVIDEFRVWKEERSLEEILATMNKSLSGNEENLALYYNFDQVTNGVIEDLAGSNNGVISQDGAGNLECGLFKSDAIFTPVLKPVTNVGIDNFTINWYAVPNAMDYYIDVATDPEFKNLVRFGESANGANTYTVNGLSRGTVYYYKVTVKTHKNETGSQYGHVATKLNPPGNAFAFDGTTYIDATDICKYDFQGTTVEGWINFTQACVDRRFAIWAINPADGFNNYVLFYILNSSSGKYELSLSQYDYSAGKYADKYFTGTTLSTGWHHIAVTIDKDGGNSFALLDAQNIGTFTALEYPYPYGSYFSLGQEYDGVNGTNPSDYFPGEMDEFRVWSKPLSEAEIQANMNKTLTGKEDGLVTYYNFDLQTGDKVIDNANIFDGNVIGTPNWVESTAGLKDFVANPSAQTTSGFTINWDALPGASDYLVDVATDAQFNNKVIDAASTSGATTYDVAGLNEGIKYYFRVASAEGDISAVNYTSTQMSPPGNALLLDGKDDYLEANQVAELNFGDNATIECWGYLDPTETYGRFIAINSSGGGNRYLLSYEGAKGYCLYDAKNDSTISSCDTRKGSWVHLAATLNAAGNVSFYLNGKLVGTSNNGYQPFINGDLVSFGQEFDGAKATDFLKGAIDEIRIWNGIRTQDEIVQNMNRKLDGTEAGLEAYYDFDLSEGQFVYEKVKGLDATIIGNPQWVRSDALITPLISSVDEITPTTATLSWNAVAGATDYKVEVAGDAKFANIVQSISSTSNANSFKFTGLSENTVYYVRIASLTNRWSGWSQTEKISTLLFPPGNALVFNGIDGQVNVGHVMNNNWSEITLEAWVKISPDQKPDVWPRIISNFGSGGGFSLNIWNKDENPVFEFQDINDGSWDTLRTSTTVGDNLWHHLACTYDGTYMVIYLDGDIIASKLNVGAVIGEANESMGIGNSWDGSRWNPLNGSLDEIRIWNVARTQAEIQEYAHKTLTGSESGLVSYFNFDKADGTTFKDEAGNFDGNMTGGVTWAESKALITPFVSEATNVADNSFTANWQAVPNASKYILRVATDKLLTQPVEGMDSIDVSSVLTYNIPGLTENTTYYYGVMSYTDRYSAWSASPEVKTTGTSDGELAINLAGRDNYLDMAALIPKLAGKNTGAVTAWFKAKEEGMVFIMSEYDYYDPSYTTNNVFWLSVGRAGMDRRSLVFEISRGGSIVQSMSVMNGNDTYLDDKWHHIAVITGDGNNRILLDGKEQELYFYQDIGNKQTQEFSNIYNATSFKIGKGSSIQVDELAFYKNPITNEEAIERAHRKLVGNEVGLIAYYNFDNQNANDVAFGHNGTVQGAASYVRAHVNQTPFLNTPVQGVTVADLSWASVSGATEYVIDVAKDIYFQDKIVDNQSLTGSSYHLDLLDKNTKYYYHVKAKVNGEWSEYSATGEIFTLPGKSLKLNGVDQYLNCGKISNYVSNQATVECWVKYDADASHNGTIWANNLGTNTQYILYYDFTHQILNLGTSTSLTAGKLKNLDSLKINLLGAWHHIAVSIIKDGLSNVYIDGKKMFEFTCSLAPIVNNCQLTIGHGTNYSVDNLKGEVDEFRVWNTALTQAQIRTNMNVSEPDDPNGNLIAHYTFDEIADGNTVFKDWAKYNNAAIINGATNTNSEGVIIPIILEATNPTPGSFDMHINNIASAKSFEVEVAYDPTFVPPLAVLKNIGRNLDYTVDGLCPGVKYYYRTRAIYDDNNISDWSTPDTMSTVNQDAVIGNFTATQGDYSQKLKLSWDCQNEYLVSNFEIKRHIAGKGDFKYLATVPNEHSYYEFIDSLAEPGTYYEYTIQGLSYCYNNDTKIDTSNIGYNLPSLELSKEINNQTQEAYIRLDWKYSPDFCKNVEIVRTNNENGMVQTFQEVADSLLYRDGAVSLCTPYSYQLVAKTADYGDVKSHSAVFTLEEDIFDAIDTLDASKSYFDSKVTLSWVSHKQNIIDQYEISRRKYASNSEWQVVKIIDRGTTQNWIDEDAVPGEYYEYVIVGIGTCGDNTLYTDSVKSVGFRQPEGTISGQINYQGGNPVANVKVIASYADPSQIPGSCLQLDGTDSMVIAGRKTFDFTDGMTLEAWIRPNSLNNSFTLFQNSGVNVSYDNGGALSVTSGAASASYDLKADADNVWKADSWNHVAVVIKPNELGLLVNGQGVATGSAATSPKFDNCNLVGKGLNGYIDELHIWNAARTDSLINRTHNLVPGRSEDNLICALRFDENLGSYAFDHTRTSDEPNKSHATIYGAQWSNNVPSLATLAPAALTEPTGNYQINGIWFKGGGDTYEITPSFGVHQFDPSNRSMLISENSLVHGSQDFTDISSFNVTGNVKYYGADFPVEGVMLAVDGQICVDPEGAPITTNETGNFAIEVPIGEHFISVSKMGHVFSEGYYPAKKASGDVDYALFTDDVAGIQFIDSTFLTVAGRMVGGTVEGDKPVGFGKSKNNLGVCKFTIQAVKGYPIDGANNSITVSTDPQSGEYKVKLYPEQFQFVVDALHHIGNSQYNFNAVDDKANINLADPLLDNTSTDTAKLVIVTGTDTSYRDTVYRFTYQMKRNWIYRSIPSIEVLSKYNTPYFYDSLAYVQNAAKDTVSFQLINSDGSNRLAYPAFTKGKSYSTVINVFEEYTNADNGTTDRVPVQDGKVTVINGCATYPAPVDYQIQNGKVIYDFVGGFPNPTMDNTSPELSFTKTFEVHSYTGVNGSMQSQWPKNEPFRAYVFGGIPTGQNFITQGPDQLDFVLRDPPGSNSAASFEKGFTVTNTVSNSFDNSASMNTSLNVDLGWEVTTFIGFGAGIINTTEQVANVEAGIGFESSYSGGHSSEQSTTFTQSYSTSDDPLYDGAMGDLFFGHSTNINYGVSNCINIIPAGTGEQELNTQVDGFTVGLKKGINLGLKYGTSFIYTQNHIENYLIPGLEEIQDKLQKEGNIDSANFYNQQADLWRKTLATNEYDKYLAIKNKNSFPENKNISFDAGSVYTESMQSETTESHSSSFEFSINSSVSSELGFEAFGMGSTWKMESSVSHSQSTESENSNTESSTVSYTLNDGDQGDYFSVDILKSLYGWSPVFSTLGGQSACPYEGGTKVQYADYLGQNHPADFNNDFRLSNPTMRIEVPKISAVNAVISGVPEDQPAVFTLKLSNQSEVNADNWFTLDLDASSNPNGAKLIMDGAAIVSGISVMIPGGTTLTKTLELVKGQASVNNYENIRLILHSQCQFDPTDDIEDIADTLTLSANFVPTCTAVNIQNPMDNWVINASARDTMPVNISGYDVNFSTFEKVALQYKDASASTWNTVAMFFNDTANYAAYSGEKAKIDGKDNVKYMWNIRSLQDRVYQIRAAAMCKDGSVSESEPLTGTLDGQLPQVFGTPSPADGILSPEDDIMLTFNEPIEAGLVSNYDIDVEGVLNGTELNHGTSVLFDGANDYAVTPEGISFNETSWSVEAWIQKATAASGTVLSTGRDGQGTFSIGMTPDSVKVTIDDNTWLAKNQFNDGNWHHYAVVYDTAKAMLTIYADDQLIMEKPVNGVTAAGPVYFGKSCFGNENHFAGSIHDMRIWRGAQAYTDVIQNMNIGLTGNEPGLNSYWPMDEATGSVLLDKARSRNATLYGNWNIQPGGYAYGFDGTQALDFSTASIPVSNEMDMTIEMWFNGGAQVGNGYLFSNGNTGIATCPAAKTINIYMNSQGNIVVENNNQSIVTDGSYNDNNWHQLAFVVNRRGYATLYMDGEKTNSITAPQIGSMESAYAWIGARGYVDNSLLKHTDGYFNGSVDEVRIWNLARRQDQIKMYMNNRFSGTETGLLAYFPFEKYQESMGVMQSVSTLDDQSVDPNSAVQANHVGTLAVTGAENFTQVTPNIRREKPRSKVNYDFVINNDKIIITPTDPLSKIERCVLEITVKDIQDKHANSMASPVTWTAYIDKNQVRWGQESFNLKKEVSEPLSFKTTISNMGGVEQPFSVTNLPPWLTATPTNGTLAPNSSTEVTFTVNDGLNIGNYNEEVYLQSGSGYNEKLLLNLDVYKQSPDWKVDESLFSSSMNIVGQLRVRGIFSSDPNDMIGVFAGNECRGVAHLQYQANYDDYFTFLVVYGNTTGENLTYKVWDASEGKVYSDVTPSYSFEPNKLYGSIASPVIFDVSGLIDNTLTLNAGWNWISFNLEMDDPSVSHVFSGMPLSNGDVIKHAGSFSAYDEAGEEWFGTLMRLRLENSIAYNLQPEVHLLILVHRPYRPIIR